MSEEVDFITTIANLKKLVKEAEAAMGNVALRSFRFNIFKPLRNTGGEGGYSQHEEGCEYSIGEINLNRERLKKKATRMNLSNEAAEIKHAKEHDELRDDVLMLKTIRGIEIKGKKCSQCQFFFGHCSMSQWSGRHEEYQDGEACMYIFLKEDQ